MDALELSNVTRFENHDIIRTRISRKRKIFVMFSLIIGFLLIFLLLFLRIWLVSNAVEIAYETDVLMEEKERLAEENRKISYEITKLESPDRISKIAVNDLKMVNLTGNNIIFLEK